MALEDFNTNKFENEWTTRKRSDSDDSDESNSQPVTLGDSLIESIHEWLSENSDRKWVKATYIEPDMDMAAHTIGLQLSKMEEMEKWRPESDSCSIYKNPYYS